MRLFRAILLSLLFVFIFSGNGQALVVSKSTDLVKVSVITECDDVNECGIDVLVRFEIKDGWHIYGDPAGEAAMPTQFNWNGSEVDFVSATVTKEFNFEGFRQFGYDNVAYYKFRLNKPADIVHLDVTWLACNNKECVPERVSFDFGLPVVDGETSKDLRWDAENKKAMDSFVRVSDEESRTFNIWFIVLMAFAGGIVLNFMPCIFPIISIKAISLVQNANKHRKARAEAVFYFVGVVASFLIIATILIILRLKGEAVGWGFQLQSPLFIVVMIVIFFIIFLMLLDVVNIRNPLANSVGRISFAKQKLNAFVTGFFAVLIASPCTAPFMGIAIGYTLSQPLYMYYPVFLALAVGYALPFSLIGFFPRALSKVLPKPGRWMIILKRLFAVPVLITCVWLVWVLYAQVATTTQKGGELEWIEFDEGLVDTLVDSDEPVFIDFTAKWCITCLANETFVLETKEFKKLVHEKGIHIFKADWTLKDEAISRALEKYGRNSIPLYVYCANKHCEVLPQILTDEIVAKKIMGEKKP